MSRHLLSQASHLQWAAHMALRAPSLWNTQPWRWHVLDDSIELWADRERQLVTADPDGRLMTVSCGTALHHLRTALVASGDEPIIQRLPDPATPDLLARVSLRTPSIPTERDSDYARFAAIARRRTDRRPFSDTPVDPVLLGRLRAVAAEEGVRLAVLDSGGVSVLADLASKVARTQAHDGGYRAELDAWTHRPRFAADGLSPHNAQFAADRLVPLREFVPGDGADHVDHADALLDRCATYAVLWGERDDPLSWLRAGEALSAILLEATVEELAVSPISNVVELDTARLAVGDLLCGRGHPYLALRMGWPARTADEDDARTRRLAPSRRIDVEDVAVPAAPEFEDLDEWVTTSGLDQ